MAEEKKSSQIIEAESNLRIVRLSQRFDEITRKETFKADKDIVAFVGPTKGGKSTLINCLLGNQLMCKRDKETEDIFIIKAPEISGPKIGESGESETVEPENFVDVPDIDYSLWDFAGFGDNKGTEQEIVNAISYQKVLSPQNTVRFVLVAPCDLIKAADPLPFYRLLNELQQICPQIADSLCIVSTKAEKGSVKGLLEKAKSSQFLKGENSNIDIINRSKKLIERVLENETYVDFKAPALEEGVDEGSFILPNKQQFVDCIKKLNGIKLTDFPLVISESAKREIAELYTGYYQTVKREVDNMNSLIEQYFQKRIDEVLTAKEGEAKTSAASRLAIFKKGKSTITDIIEKSKSFEEFFRQVKDAGIVIHGFAETIHKFLFVEKLRNLYKMNDTEKSIQGESEFFNNVKVALISGEIKYSNMIISSEAATEEEKRKEKEWQKSKDIEISSLKEKIQSAEKYNKSILVTGAKWIHDNITEPLSRNCVIS